MSIGAPKCGVTIFHGDLNTLRGGQWKLQGQDIPVVESYTYLGIETNSNWDLSKLVVAVSNKARRALWSLRPALGNPMIPLAVKAQMIKSLVVPVAAFGGELLGMVKERAKSNQRIVDQGLKWALAGDISKGTVVAAATARAEFGLTTLHATWSSRRTRGWVKFRQLKTWISTLVSNPFKHRKNTWVSGTSRWLKRMGATQLVEGKPSKKAASAVLKLVEGKETEGDKTESLASYRRWKLGRSEHYLKKSLRHPGLALGVRWLARLRTKSFWTGPRAAHAKLVPAWWGSMCPSCEGKLKEDIPHILLECPLHNEARCRLIQPVVGWATGTISAPSREELAMVLLGGQVGRVDLSKQWLGEAKHNPCGEKAPFLRVAEYLQEIMPSRMRNLWGDQIPQGAFEEVDTVVLPRNFLVQPSQLEIVIPLVPVPRSRSPIGYGSSSRAGAD